MALVFLKKKIIYRLSLPQAEKHVLVVFYLGPGVCVCVRVCVCH